MRTLKEPARVLNLELVDYWVSRDLVDWADLLTAFKCASFCSQHIVGTWHPPAHGSEFQHTRSWIMFGTNIQRHIGTVIHDRNYRAI